MTGKLDANVREAHLAWNAANENLRNYERLLASALELFASGRGPLPQDMIDECNAMRADCNEKFQAMLAAMRRRMDEAA